MLGFFARLFLIRRLLGGRSSSRSHARRHDRRGYGRRRSSGFGMTGPFPSYTRRTRGGGRVSVGGCCLPIPLTLILALAAAFRTLVRR